MAISKKAAAGKAARSTKGEAKTPPIAASSIDGWIAALEPWQQQLVGAFAALVARTVQEASAYVKWGHPVWDFRGPFVLIKPYGGHVTVGFWRGAQLTDTAGILEGGGGMRYAKIKAGDRLPASLAPLLREAAALNERLGDPLKR
jgi:hypothetical protein